MKNSLRCALGVVIAMLAWGAACGAPQSGPQEPAVVQPGSHAAPAVAPPQDPAGNASTNVVQCGKQACNATSEVCCGFSNDYGCAPRVPMVPANVLEQRLGPLMNSCKAAVKSEYSFDALLLCDDSTDCPTGQVCCSQWLWSGASLLECLPAAATGESVCDYGERCVADSCVTRGTDCRESECRLVGAKVKCAGVVCGADAPICCQHGYEGPPKCERDCKAPDEDSRAFEFECSGPASCPAGTTCQSGMFGSYCARSVDYANAVVLCESDADCPEDGCAWLGKKDRPVCKDGQRPGFTHCACD